MFTSEDLSHLNSMQSLPQPLPPHMPLAGIDKCPGYCGSAPYEPVVRLWRAGDSKHSGIAWLDLSALPASLRADLRGGARDREGRRSRPDGLSLALLCLRPAPGPDTDEGQKGFGARRLSGGSEGTKPLEPRLRIVLPTYQHIWGPFGVTILGTFRASFRISAGVPRGFTGARVRGARVLEGDGWGFPIA